MDNSYYKKIDDEALAGVSGGGAATVTPATEIALARMTRTAKIEYEAWSLLNPNASEADREKKMNELTEAAYWNLSAEDRVLIDLYRAKA